MNKINDYELIMLWYEKNEEAEELLLKRYASIIRGILKTNKNEIRKIGLDPNELYTKYLEDFEDIVGSFDSEKEASFKTWVSMIITRKIKKELVRYSRPKNRILLDSLSLDSTLIGVTPIGELVKADAQIEPINHTLRKELYESINDFMTNELSSFEQKVCSLMLDKLSYQEIASRLHKSYTQIANTVQRIRKKATKLI